jgi:hypothetical protein
MLSGLGRAYISRDAAGFKADIGLAGAWFSVKGGRIADLVVSDGCAASRCGTGSPPGRPPRLTPRATGRPAPRGGHHRRRERHGPMRATGDDDGPRRWDGPPAWWTARQSRAAARRPLCDEYGTPSAARG